MGSGPKPTSGDEAYQISLADFERGTGSTYSPSTGFNGGPNALNYLSAFDPSSDVFTLNPIFEKTFNANVLEKNPLKGVVSTPPQIDPKVKAAQSNFKFILAIAAIGGALYFLKLKKRS